MKEKKKSKVLLALSGGVDSSVAAALLKKQGYQVIAVFMIFQKDRIGAENKCCSLEAKNMAQQVAAQLAIPFYAVDFSAAFKKQVIAYFLDEFKNGRIPNPCVVCNQYIKFGLLLDKARELGVDMVATGHYARARELRATAKPYKLLRGKDQTRDQSYFLYNLTQKKLARILFPLGEYQKTQVRQMAQDFNLPSAKRAESREICFVDSALRAYLQTHLRKYIKAGDFIDEHGQKIGQHQGALLYALGQRAGLGGQLYYVTRTDCKNNKVYITSNPNDKKLWQKKMKVKKVNWISGAVPALPFKCQAQIRYLHPACDCQILGCKNNKYQVEFNEPQRAITPGQSAVFYQGEEVLGGGIIC